MNNENLRDLVCCPNCQGDLIGSNSLKPFEKEKGVTNVFECKNCNVFFRKKNGILILISKELEEELRN